MENVQGKLYNDVFQRILQNRGFTGCIFQWISHYLKFGMFQSMSTEHTVGRRKFSQGGSVLHISSFSTTSSKIGHANPQNHLCRRFYLIPHDCQLLSYKDNDTHDGQISIGKKIHLINGSDEQIYKFGVLKKQNNDKIFKRFER